MENTKRCLCGAALTLIVSATSLAGEELASKLPFRLFGGHLVVVRGSVGATDGLDFLIDTGSSQTLVDMKIVRALRLATAEYVRVESVKDAGAQEVVLPELRFGPVRLESARVLAADLSFTSVSGTTIEAIVGLDVLRLSSFSIDYGSRLIAFGPVPDSASAVPFQAISPLLTVDVALGDRTARLLVDTGAARLTLFPNRMQSRLPGFLLKGAMTGHTAGGTSQLRDVELAAVRLLHGMAARAGVPRGCARPFVRPRRGAGADVAGREIHAFRLRAQPVGLGQIVLSSARSSQDSVKEEGMDGAFRAGEWLVEPQLNLITDDTRTIHLEPKAMKVLVYLASHAHEVVPKERLIHAVWPDTFVTDDVLTHAISELRRAFGDDARRPRFILTVPKGGYQLVAPLQRPLEARVSDPESAQPHLVATTREPANGRNRWRVVSALAALLGIAAATGYWLTRPPLPPRVGHSVQVTRSGHVAVVEFHREVFPAVVSDGVRMYFSRTGTSAGLSVVPLGGGDADTIAVPTEVCGASVCTIDDISPDGSALLVRRFLDEQAESPLWVLPTGGGAAHRVGEIVAHAATWLRGGEAIAFAYGNDVFVARSNGAVPRKLLGLPARAFWLRAAPDGRRLRFTVRDPRTNALSLWQATVEGTNLHQVLPGWSDVPSECCGNWTPDGKYFLFQSARGGAPSIWALREQDSLMRRGAREPIQLTAGHLRFHTPMISRDGRQLFAVGKEDRVEPVVFDTQRQHFLPFLPGIARGGLKFSRDGRWIADVAREGMWRMKADGSERVQLTSLPMSINGYFNWSPDGTRIAFAGKLPGRPWKIYLISRDGGNPVQLTADDRPETDPDWSPDGSAVMFGRLPDYMAEAFLPKAIHIYNLKTQEVSTVPDSQGLFSPHWSPDGRYIAAQPMKQGKLLLFDFVTRKWVELAKRHPHNPTWSSDSRYVYGQDKAAIWRVRISDGIVEDVARHTDLRRGLAAFYTSGGLTPDDSPLGVIFYGNADIYAWPLEAP